MNIPINQERLARTFIQLCEIDSPSRREKAVADYLRRTFHDLGAEKILEDKSAEQTGSQCGNLIISIAGTRPEQETILLACHMDTVEPGCGVQVLQTGDIFTSQGDTVLGGDDKSGIAAVIELIRILQENKIDHGPLELLFTTCEEIGLLGAKALDWSRLTAAYGYALDSSGIDRIIIGAPAANKLLIDIHGIAAHAGLHPEQGISALCLAAQAIANLRLGRLDDESTANLGLIHGGVATNIIPDHIIIEGEVRSHSLQKLAAHTAAIQRAFQREVDNWPALAPTALEHISDTPPQAPAPSVMVNVQVDYPAMHLALSDPVLRRVQQAGLDLGRTLEFQVAGGGSDANILNSFGLPTAIIATGMNKVHTTDEYLDLKDLVRLTELLFALVAVGD